MVVFVEKSLPAGMKLDDPVKQGVGWQKTHIGNGASNRHASATGCGFVKEPGQPVQSWTLITFLKETTEILHF